MTYQEFEKSLQEKHPPENINEILRGLWYDANGDWEAGHNVAQSKEGTQAYDRLHAYLHRVEGDTRNAGYWYRCAGSVMPESTLQEEWEALVKENI